MSGVRQKSRMAMVSALAMASAMSPPPSRSTGLYQDRPRYTRAEAKKRRRNRMRNKMARISRRINRRRARV